MIRNIFGERKLIWKLAKNDFKTKYAGSFLGIVWGFIQPIVTVMVYWIVFQYGLRVGTSGDVPYVLWFITGLVPWFYFSETLTAATNCLLEYNYLVKKMAFEIEVLPIVKMVSGLFIHLAFMGFLFILFAAYGRLGTVSLWQIIYYLACMMLLVLGMSFITSAIVVFVRDIGQIIGIFLQIFMWATPILWEYTRVPEQFQWILWLNPMFYVVQGYRDAFIGGGYPWTRGGQMIYFWILTGVLLIVGIRIFKRLRPHLADML